MTDPRAEMRATLAQWLRLRDGVRKMQAALTAAERAQMRDARRSSDPAMTVLATQLETERAAFDVLARDLDDRIEAARTSCGALEDAYIAGVVESAVRE